MPADERFESGIHGGNLRRVNPADDVHNRFVAPPALAFIGHGLDGTGAVEQSGCCRDNGPVGRFSKVIDAAPEKLAGMLHVITGRQPCRKVMSLLGADNLASGFSFVGSQQFEVAVVRADDVQQIRQTVVIIMAHIRAEKPLRHRPRGIGLVEHINEAGQYSFCQLAIGCVVDLVPPTVKNDARMIAITQHRIADVGLGPVVEVQVIIERILGNCPAIEQFVHDQKAHAIAQVEELRRRWIMRRADGIDSQRAQLFQAALPNAQRHSGAERAAIMMEADTFDFHIFAIQPKPGFGHEARISNAKGHHLIIKDGVRRPDHEVGTIKIRTIQLPEFGI